MTFLTVIIAELIRISVERNLITLEDLYKKKEQELISIFNTHFSSWNSFPNAKNIIGTNNEPCNFYVSLEVKKRNVIPLVKNNENIFHIIDISNKAKKIYKKIKNYKDFLYGYIEEIKEV